MNKKIPFSFFLITSLAVVGIYGYYAFAARLGWWPCDGIDLEKRGQYGDSFGVFTALFSALGFLGIVLTLKIQQDSLSESEERNKIQHFESVIFGMLSVLNDIVSGMDIHKHATREIVAEKRDCFYFIVRKELLIRYNAYKIGKEFNSHDSLKVALRIYDLTWRNYRQNLSHYFRFIYNIFRYIDDSGFDQAVKDKYARIVRAQISDYELLVIFYNCIHANGREKFKPLVEKYRLFNNLPLDMLLDQGHKQLYAEIAFGE